MFIPIDSEHFSRGPLSFSTAVRLAYEYDLDWIESMLRSGLSVLVTAEKSLALPLYAELRQRLKRGDPPLLSVLIKSPPSGQNRSFLHGMVEHLWEQVQEQLADPVNVVVLPHLDLLATTTESSLGTPAREAMAAMSQDPSLRFLAFCDPGLQLPQAIADLFDVHREITGIKRDTLRYLVTYEEAQRFGVDRLNLFRLYKYVSGLHVIKFRKIMLRLLDFPPLLSLPPEEREPQRQRIERILREMTLLGGMEIPAIDLQSDVGGYSDIKKKLQDEILDILSLREDPGWSGLVSELEETLPHGILLYGPPGTGKTYLAKALATSLQATTLVVSGPEIKSKWVGESEANLRRLFAQARSAAPALIIFDEIDAIAPRRGVYTGSGVEHSLVNQLLTEMDGFRKEELVFVVGTTNLIESVDPALLRPGRFEYHLHIPYPDRQARREIIEVYLRRFRLSLEPDTLEYWVERTGGYVDATRGVRYSGDHLYGIARQLKRLQARRRDLQSPFPVTQAELDEVMGPAVFSHAERKARSRRKTAYHEAGHTLAAVYILEPQAVQKASIATENPDVEGVVSIHSYVSEGATQATLLHLIQVALAGRAAEQIVFQEIDMGAKNDLDFATEMARMMVEDLGMSAQFGPRVYRLGNGREVAVGSLTRERMDQEINQILFEQYKTVETLLMEKREQLEQLTQALLQQGELENSQIMSILGLPGSETGSGSSTVS